MVRNATDGVRRPALALVGFLLVAPRPGSLRRPGPDTVRATGGDRDRRCGWRSRGGPRPAPGPARGDPSGSVARSDARGLRRRAGSAEGRHRHHDAVPGGGSRHAAGGHDQRQRARWPHVRACPPPATRGSLPVRLDEFADGVHLTAAMRVRGAGGRTPAGRATATDRGRARGTGAPGATRRSRHGAGLPPGLPAAHRGPGRAGAHRRWTGAAHRRRPRRRPGTNGDRHARALRGVRGLGRSRRDDLPAGSIGHAVPGGPRFWSSGGSTWRTAGRSTPATPRCAVRTGPRWLPSRRGPPSPTSTAWCWTFARTRAATTAPMPASWPRCRRRRSIVPGTWSSWLTA